MATPVRTAARQTSVGARTAEPNASTAKRTGSLADANGTASTNGQPESAHGWQMCMSVEKHTFIRCDFILPSLPSSGLIWPTQCEIEYISQRNWDAHASEIRKEAAHGWRLDPPLDLRSLRACRSLPRAHARMGKGRRRLVLEPEKRRTMPSCAVTGLRLLRPPT